MQNIAKLCADHLRVFLKDNYNTKLKASHAHELVAAYFGYNSRAALLTDTKCCINNLSHAEIIVMMTDTFIDKRRKDLQGLPAELPDSYKLGEEVYTPLFSDQFWKSKYPPFRSFKKLAKFIIENSDLFQQTFKSYKNLPMHHVVDVKSIDDGMLLTVTHAHQTSKIEIVCHAVTTIKLKRVAGHIGYNNLQVSPITMLTGGARRTLLLGGAQ
ncbi:Atc1 protein [Waddlia chondrophila 2032/99]|uniref:Atc1 protein n=1 Tax=Waddlia chondrophila 2032/99 TaxID=765953 RepID=F8LCT0_9BACT|nr:Atc1 protein [Waddlia chondrophila 2032/99]